MENRKPLSQLDAGMGIYDKINSDHQHLSFHLKAGG
jgi:hypothetical protein